MTCKSKAIQPTMIKEALTFQDNLEGRRAFALLVAELQQQGVEFDVGTDRSFYLIFIK